MYADPADPVFMLTGWALYVTNMINTADSTSPWDQISKAVYMYIIILK